MIVINGVIIQNAVNDAVQEMPAECHLVMFVSSALQQKDCLNATPAALLALRR